MLLNYLRNTSFWWLDTIKGSKVRRELNEIESLIEDPKSKNSNTIRKKHLDRLLAHATTTTPYYKLYENYSKLEDFPVIRKTIIQENFDSFQSTKFKGLDNFKVSTSGSTGVPFFLFQDNRKRLRNHADVIYFFNQSSYNVGNRLYELEVWRNHNKKGKFKSWLQNLYQFDVSRLTDERIEEFLQILQNDQQSNKSILGFASALEMIAQYLERKNQTFETLNLSSVIANSEYLNPYTKETLGKYLNTQILSRYSSEEIGIIAQQTLESPNNFVINHASYIVEILNFENDEPANPGEFGRIIVTDLFNYAMPIIRYDTGDIAKLGINSKGAIELNQIEGRKMDVIHDTDGNLISSFVVYTKFYKYYHLLKQYQFIQQGEKDYELKLNLHNQNFSFESDLINDIKSDFGQNANIKITYVDEIPPLSSGKRRKVVNNYKNKLGLA